MMLTNPKFTNNYDGTYTVSNTCTDCKTKVERKIDSSELFRFNQGDHVQVAFPTMPAADREFFFMTGICGECWEKLFADEEF